jgi:tetratricopeptide (TPR) repeat protein
LIDLKQELQNYPPINLESLLQKDPGIPDRIRNSITLYNKALESIRMKSEDIAIIELKKAISMNPNFCEAMNLLGLCYIYINDYPKAQEMFQKVMTVENNSVRALEYMKMLNPDNTYSESKSKRRKKPKIKKPSEQKEEVAASPKTLKIKGKGDITKYIIGFAVGALLVFLLGLINTGSGTPNNLSDQLLAENNQLNEEITMYKTKLDKLDADFKSLQRDLESANSSIDYYKSAIKLYEIESLVHNKEYESAADMLILMKTIKFEGQEKERFDNLYSKVMPIAAKTVFEQGYSLFNSSRNYQDALAKLRKVELYTDEFERMDVVLYYIGKSYQALEDSRNAIATYQRLIESYPKSKYATYAGYRINELTQVP